MMPPGLLSIITFDRTSEGPPVMVSYTENVGRFVLTFSVWTDPLMSTTLCDLRSSASLKLTSVDPSNPSSTGNVSGVLANLMMNVRSGVSVLNLNFCWVRSLIDPR